MSGRVMRKFRHAGKKAVKFRFCATLEKLIVEGTRSWQPHKLAVVWTRRKRRKASTSQSWRPGIENPFKGAVEWSKLSPEILEIEVTLFKDERRGIYEAKDWVFVLENETQNGKRKAVATARVDMSDHVNEISSPKSLRIKFKSLTSKLASANLSLMLRCEFLKEGSATDPDMASLAGSTTSEDTIRLGSVDVCDFSEFDDSEMDGFSRRSGSMNSRGSSTKNQILELTQQIEMFSKGFKEDGHDATAHADAISNISNQSAASDKKSSSRQPSVSSNTADKSSLGSSKSSHEKGDEKKPEDTKSESSLEKKVENIRHSSASESGDGSEPSPIQKRRLRPSVDVVPSRQTDSLQLPSAPIAYGSPASELHRPLLNWCQLVTTGYRGVKVTNFTTSWRNGLAFCSVLHYIKPETIVYSDLKPLDGRENLKKAFQGFKDLGFNTEEISKAMRTNSGGIATKAIIISFLTEVKEYFDKHDMGDAIQLLKKDKSEEKRETKQNRISLANIMREKLLSDLEEKEGEDDVFSCVLDDVLEKETSPDVLHLSISDESEGPHIERDLAVTYIDDSTRLSTISEYPNSGKRKNDERMNSFLLPKEGSSDKTQQDEGISPFTPKISEFDSSTPISRTNQEDNSKTGDSSEIPVIITPEKRNPAFHFSPGSMIRASTTPPSSPAVHLLKDPFVKENLTDVASTLVTFQEKDVEETSTPTYQSPPSPKDPSYVVQTEQIPKKPMSEKRVKALALIEQFKAESSKKNEDWKTMSLSRDFDGKRREEVRERAKKLIEETKASLDIKSSYSSEDVDKEPVRNGMLQGDIKDVKEKYATLPLGKSSWKQEEPSMTKDVQQMSSTSITEDSSHGSFSINTGTPGTPGQIFGNPFEDIKHESAINHIKVFPVSPTKLLTFSEFEKLPDSNTESVKVDVSPAIIKLSDEPKKIHNSADYNGNSVQNHDSQYLLIGSQENLVTSTSKYSEDSQDVPDGSKMKEEDPSPKDHLIPPEKILKDSESDSDLFIPEPPTEEEDASRLDVQANSKEFSDTTEISLNEFENSASVLTLESSNPFELDDSTLPAKNIATESFPSQESESKESSSILQNTKVPIPAASIAGNASVRNSELPSKRVDISVIKTENHQENIQSDPLGAITPPRLDANGPQLRNDLATSTPMVEQSPVKYRNPKHQPNTNGGAVSPAKSLASQSTSPIRVTAVKPVKMSDLETFSPILSTTKKDQLTADSPRSRPSSIKLSRRKSSTSSIRKSIAANDTSPLEQERVALEEEMRTVDDRSAEVREELQDIKNSGRGKFKQREEILMQEWFQLVQKKNAIVRQQDQLIQLEQEHDLGVQMNEVNEQLRAYYEIEESQKTEAQKLAEKGLLDQLICLVNERDRIIRKIDENEQEALDDDMHVQTNLDQNMSTVFNKEEEKCAIM